MTARPILHIGNKRYSSWSLRAWLVLAHAGIDFDEVTVALDTPESPARLASLSHVRTVPVLRAGGAVIWDSLAIAEWAAEREPGLWPRDPALRAVARAHAATMHAGFAALRAEAPMNLAREGRPKALSDAARRDVELIAALWRERAPGAPYLFGDWCVADAFWTPVATRIRSYALDLDPAGNAYVDMLLADPHYRRWRGDALGETFPNPLNDDV